MHKPSLMDKLRYRLDNVFSKGTAALIGLLALGSIAVIVFVALVVRLLGLAPERGFLDLVWMALLRTLDPGTMGGDQGGWPFLFAMLAVTVGGIFIISSLIGILTTGLEARLDSLRKGRSRVIESGHTVILGWSPQIIAVVSELIQANANQRHACIVILGDKDKVEMQEELTEKISDTKTTRIVCRHGSPIEVADLQIVSLNTAKSIIVLRPDGDDPDAQVIKVLLAITNAPQRRAEPYHIVAEIHDPKNMAVAKLVGGGEVELIPVGELIARIMAQTCRQSGLSIVYNELLDFGGDEIYFKAEPSLSGKTFGDALSAYDDSTLIGIGAAGQAPKLKPAMGTVIRDEDRLTFIARDDDTIRPSGLTQVKIQQEVIVTRAPSQAGPERTLILGWNWRAPLIISELDHYVVPGSTVTLVADDPASEIAAVVADLPLHNQALTFRSADTTDRRILDELEPSGFQHIIVLSYSDIHDTQRADARTLVTLLHLRDMADRAGHPFSIVSEMLDIRNRNLAEVTHADDFIVSDRLISLMLAQVAENKALNAVFADLFDPEGAEVYLKPVSDYVRLGVAIEFYTLLEAARRRGEVAIGYRLAALSSAKDRQYGVVINPVKSKEVTFQDGDRVIVLAESW